MNFQSPHLLILVKVNVHNLLLLHPVLEVIYINNYTTNYYYTIFNINIYLF